MIPNRFYFVLLLVVLLYVSLALHEIADTSGTNSFGRAGVSIEFLNRSVVARVDMKQYCRAPRIAVLISPGEQRFLQLYWDVEFIGENDWIGLFKEDPQKGTRVFPIFTAAVKNATGIVETNITEMSRRSRDLSFTAQCLGYWAAYFTHNGTAAAVSCLKTNPTWMYDIRKHLENSLIKRMFIPGTHDSGSYSSSDQPVALNVLEHYVLTQEEDILSQLIHGIRYLDLRVSSNKQLTERWWVNHGVVRVQPLKNVIQDVKTFLQNTKEIVILDFHGFPFGFTDGVSTHHEFISHIKSEFSEWIAPPNWNATCGDLWKLNKRLIISYNEKQVQPMYPADLWTPVHHKWANVQDVELLKEYFQAVLKSRPSYAWAAMAELTPTLWSILTYRTRSLRAMAQEVNFHVTSWFRRTWGRSCNIVAVDFFRGTDIIDAAIDWNIRRNEKHICDIH